MALNKVIPKTDFTDESDIQSGTLIKIKSIHIDELRKALTKLDQYSVNVDNCGNCTFCQSCQTTTCQTTTCQTATCQKTTCQSSTCQSQTCQRCQTKSCQTQSCQSCQRQCYNCYYSCNSH